MERPWLSIAIAYAPDDNARDQVGVARAARTPVDYTVEELQSLQQSLEHLSGKHTIYEQAMGTTYTAGIK